MEGDGEDVENEQGFELLFRKLDKSKSGTINKKEVQEALKAMQHVFSLRQLICVLDDPRHLPVALPPLSF